MARRLRVEYPGAIYHLMNRGDRREPIFKDDEDRQRFLDTLAEACAKTSWQIHAFVLMPNHFHLVTETLLPNLVAGMKWLLGTYTIRFNRRHKVVGHLFSGRYKALLVDGSGNGYLKSVCDYVHLNPGRANLVAPDRPLTDHRWSSWPEYLKSPSRRLSWLRVDRLLGEYGIPRDSAAGRRRLEQALEAERSAGAKREFATIRRGWFVGEETFRQELLARMSQSMGPDHYGDERAETAEAKAERIIAEELCRRRWTESNLRERPKGDASKVAMAERLRTETTLTVAWIAGRLSMGTRGYLNQLLYQRRKANKG